MALKSNHPCALVLSRIEYTLYTLQSQSFLNTFYLPPQTEDATFWVDLMSMVMNKEFPYIKQFNNL